MKYSAELVDNRHIVLHCTGGSLCVDPLFAFKPTFQCRGHTAKRCSRALAEISKVPGTWGLDFFMLPLVYRVAADLDLAVTLDCVLFDYMFWLGAAGGELQSTK